MSDINKIREEIDLIDSKILELLEKRNSVILDVANYKFEHDLPIKNQEREDSHLKSLLTQTKTMNISQDLLAEIYTKIYEDSVARQISYLQGLIATNGQRNVKINVAYLGEKGTYSYLAAHKYFDACPQGINEKNCKSFEEIIESVENGAVDVGILPIENTSSGCINEVYDLLQKANVNIIGELTYPINHGLLVRVPTDISRIKTIYSHPQPIQQCSVWLHENLPNVAFKTCSATSEAMKIIAEQNSPELAAIGCVESGKIYGDTPLIANISNQKINVTRFIAISTVNSKVPVNVPAKTSITFTTQNRPGALVKVLEIFSNQNINMVKLESRPRIANREGIVWAETFYADLLANTNSLEMQKVLNDLKKVTGEVRVLGCYPATAIPDEC